MIRGGRAAVAADDRYLTIDEAAATMRISKKTVYRRIAAGVLSARDFGSGSRTKMRVPASAIAAYAEANPI